MYVDLEKYDYIVSAAITEQPLPDPRQYVELGLQLNTTTHERYAY
jgi:hypothetical protein